MNLQETNQSGQNSSADYSASVPKYRVSKNLIPKNSITLNYIL